MPTMTGGQALMRSLYLEGVRVIFGLPGVQLYHALDALNDVPGIRFITTRHEQATTYMADGYARASGQVGTALMVPGPGLLNASAGLSTAYSASSPVLVVCGQIGARPHRRGPRHAPRGQRPAGHHPPRHQVRPSHHGHRGGPRGRPRGVPTAQDRPAPSRGSRDAARDHGRPGRGSLIESEGYPRPAASDEQVAEAARILAGAQRPLIWAGGGVISSEGSEPLVRLAERLQAPVITTAEGKGAIDDRHPLALGALRLRNDPVAKTEPNFDVILAVGTRLAFPAWLGGQRVVQVDIDPEELGRNYENTYGVQGDARTVMEQVDARLAESIAPGSRPSMADEVVALRKRRRDTALTPEPQESLLAAVRSAVPEDGILVSGMTQLGYYARAFWPTYEPRTFITSSYSGNLGYAWPTALGAKVAQPDRPVVALCGDGGFLFNSQELATAVQHGINAIAVVFNDNAYGNVLRDQVNRFDGRVVGAELHNPDFVKLAEAYGVKGIRAEAPKPSNQPSKTPSKPTPPP